MTPTDAQPPRHVLLFAGHRVDAPGRVPPRFPAAMVPRAAAAIGAALDELGADAADLAITQGACGGDLLFAEACLARDIPLRLLQPMAQAEFVRRSVQSCSDGDAWRARYDAVVARLAQPPLAMPDVLGATPDGADPWERCNRWMLEVADRAAPSALRFICLWDGGEGDGPGGTAHSVAEVRQRHGRITWLDTRVLFAG